MSFSIPVIGSLLLLDTLEQNGMMNAATAFLDGATARTAMQHMVNSPAKKNTTSFIVKESIKWGLYDAVKDGNGKIIEFGGITFRK